MIDTHKIEESLNYLKNFRIFGCLDADMVLAHERFRLLFMEYLHLKDDNEKLQKEVNRLEDEIIDVKNNYY